MIIITFEEVSRMPDDGLNTVITRTLFSTLNLHPTMMAVHEYQQQLERFYQGRRRLRVIGVSEVTGGPQFYEPQHLMDLGVWTLDALRGRINDMAG